MAALEGPDLRRERDFDRTLLVETAGGLGKWEEDGSGRQKYVKSEDCTEYLVDLLRFLAYDDPETKLALMLLHKLRIVESDIVPLLECYADDPDVAFQALRVATLLTFPDADPVAADARALRPIDPDARAAAEASVAALAAMARSRTALGALVTLAAAPLSRHPRMTERDAQVVQLVLTFARNALALAGGCGGVEVPRSLRADLLGRLGEEGVLDLVAAVAQHSDAAPFKEDRTLLLELVALIVKDAPVVDILATQRDPNTATAIATTTATAANALPTQRSQAPVSRKPPAPFATAIATAHHHPNPSACPPDPRRHPRFMRGPASLRHAASLGLVDYADMTRRLLGTGKSQGGGGAVKRKHSAYPALLAPTAALSATTLRHLSAFAEAFLDGAYDVLMEGVSREIQKGRLLSRLSDREFSHWIAVARFFTEYATRAVEAGAAAAAAGRDEGGQWRVQLCRVSATLGWESFKLATEVWTEQLDLPQGAESKHAHLQRCALGLVKEMLLALEAAGRHGQEGDRDAADRIQRRLLFDLGRATGLLPSLVRAVRQFKYGAQEAREAFDLIEAIHVALRMLEELDRRERGGFVVAGVRRGGRKRGGESQVPSAPRVVEVGEGGGDAPAGMGADVTHDSTPQQQEGVLQLRQWLAMEIGHQDMLRFYTDVLSDWPTLPPYTLHCAVAFLHRLLDPKGLAMAPMLWNLPLLTIMDEVLSHGDLTSGDGARKRAFLAKYGELAGVCRETVRRLMGRLRMGMGGDGGGGGGERGEREGWEGVGVGVQAGVMSPEGGVGGVASPHTAAATAALASADPSGTSPRPVQLREREREVVSHVRAMAFVEMCFVPCRKDVESIANDYYYKKELFPSPKRRRRRHSDAEDGANNNGNNNNDGNNGDIDASLAGDLFGGQSTGRDGMRDRALAKRRRGERRRVMEEDVARVKEVYEGLPTKRHAPRDIARMLKGQVPPATVTSALQQLGLWDESAWGKSPGARAARAMAGLRGAGWGNAVGVVTAVVRTRLREAALLWDCDPTAAYEVIPCDGDQARALGMGHTAALLLALGFAKPTEASPYFRLSPLVGAEGARQSLERFELALTESERLHALWGAEKGGKVVKRQDKGSKGNKRKKRGGSDDDEEVVEVLSEGGESDGVSDGEVGSSSDDGKGVVEVGSDGEGEMSEGERGGAVRAEGGSGKGGSGEGGSAGAGAGRGKGAAQGKGAVVDVESDGEVEITRELEELRRARERAGRDRAAAEVGGVRLVRVAGAEAGGGAGASEVVGLEDSDSDLEMV